MNTTKPQKPVTTHEQKQIECDKCGYVSNVTAFIPLKLSCCPQCGSLKIRLYKPLRRAMLYVNHARKAELEADLAAILSRP